MRITLSRNTSFLLSLGVGPQLDPEESASETSARAYTAISGLAVSASCMDGKGSSR
jgi:hypothetical protein